ncbi:GIY-YIG nuclease family protein [Aliifodinibius sp. S!AR15-10]|uniref:GIY-YIG nuclease family protein n=1 Tax=Aliifodinibius sp. S!AR15-10 TaxID=2950437 RepID=UPI0028650B12|nr:GIY-YIG nuclease family protein [Aliifodinibius sp. S!AR15-10]MDR8394102.1 GIY-YIG nuclease family protein [Aliifodinibius sp. S!AR15-10]
MWYVYVLESIDHDWTYVGFTKELKKRVVAHNAGKTQSTKAYAPFKLGAFVAVNSREKARNLEKYFKTGSGIAWMSKHIV